MKVFFKSLFVRFVYISFDYYGKFVRNLVLRQGTQIAIKLIALARHHPKPCIRHDAVPMVYKIKENHDEKFECEKIVSQNYPFRGIKALIFFFFYYNEISSIKYYHLRSNY